MPGAIRITWPSADLSPNSRGHWAKRARATKTSRRAAFYLAKEAGLNAPADGPISIHATFYPPKRHRYDRDGLMSRLKSTFDGMADAMKVDDFRFVPTMEMADDTGGYVLIEVRG